MIAGLLGALLLVLLNILSLEEAIGYISRSHATLALFFGVMVMVRAFQPTRTFDVLGWKSFETYHSTRTICPIALQS
jgi:Na+/H+ antiporter NhaD/arsenite permease-like protein